MAAIARALLLVAFAATTVAAGVHETTTVEIVEVPVYVTSHGAPLTSLTRDNFTLFVNGKPQAIEYFDRTDYATLAPESKHEIRQRRLFMLVFDLLSPANALQRARKAALGFVESAAANDTIGIATFSATGGLRIVVPFTRDHAAVERGIRALQISALNDPLHLALTPTERNGGWSGRVTDPRTDPDLLDPTVQLANIASDEVAVLTDLADRLAGMEGQKHVVLLSAGFESAVIQGLEPPRPPGDVRNGPNRTNDRQSQAPWPSTQLIRELDGLHMAYANAGVFLDAVDIAGLRPFQTSTSNDSLFVLVQGTGGRVVDRRNDLAQAMNVLSETSRVVYTLGFKAIETGRKENKITVKLVDVPRGTETSYRRTYQTGGPQIDTGDMLRLADIIQNDIAQNGITANVSASPAPNGADVEVRMPGSELLAQSDGGFAGANVMMYVMSGTSVVAFKIKRVDVNVARAEAALRESPVRVRDTFELPPGSYAAKVIVRMDITGALGFGRADVTVPAQ